MPEDVIEEPVDEQIDTPEIDEGDPSDETIEAELDDSEPQDDAPQAEPVAAPPPAVAGPAEPAQPTAQMTPEQIQQSLITQMNFWRQAYEQAVAPAQPNHTPVNPYSQPAGYAPQGYGQVQLNAAPVSDQMLKEIAEFAGYDPSDPKVHAFAAVITGQQRQEFHALRNQLKQEFAPLMQSYEQQQAAQVEEQKWAEFLQAQPPELHSQLIEMRPALRDIAIKRNLPHWFDAYAYHNVFVKKGSDPQAMQEGVRKGFTAAQQTNQKNKLANVASGAQPRRGNLPGPRARTFEEAALSAGFSGNDLPRRGR